jgi:hypothetical protein
MHSLNRRHLAAPAVDILAGMRAELLRRLRESFDGWQPAPLHTSLFGSTARGDGDSTSDVDLFLVRPDSLSEDDPRWREQVDQLTGDVFAWTGNHAVVIEQQVADILRLRRSRSPVVVELRRDGINLHGPPLEELFGAAR